jgi:F0F1-type ATP synthase assembly protein I
MPKPPQITKSDKSNNAYLVYGGMAFQFLGACLLGVFLGKWIDQKMGYDRQVWSVFLTVGFMVAAMYSVYRQLLNQK